MQTMRTSVILRIAMLHVNISSRTRKLRFLAFFFFFKFSDMFFQESFELFEYIYEYDILICISYILNDKLHITMKCVAFAGCQR